ncbi:hypothetical protein [Actibacterium lipolyticum]|uniref:Uncharacterized protein n=1 Tax=Actibacterium lipolyticum TaxID=1524263 RepID=A0A238JN35_9RHOB|nr:hypothetical protein [Actibacterium lipolyticum]SMX31905.1 hypothetical protein COL8621_00645 [Actibacterium lipolyticum]
MRGAFAGVKGEIIKGIFEPLLDEMSDEEFLDEDLWGDLFREAIPTPTAPETPAYAAFDDDGNIYLDGDIQARDAYDAASVAFHDQLGAHNDDSSEGNLRWETTKIVAAI